MEDNVYVFLPVVLVGPLLGVFFLINAGVSLILSLSLVYNGIDLVNILLSTPLRAFQG